MLHLASCGLLRSPKVYNALITTDQNITPSRSYPIIQPHIHETGIAYSSAGSYPFGAAGHPYNSFGLYDPYSPYPQFASPLDYHGRNNYPAINPFHNNANPSDGDSSQEDGNNSKQDNGSEGDTSSSNEIAGKEHKENTPIPLNEFGLPPSLVPVNPYGYHHNPINLSPYPYSSYPLIYDQYSGYNTNPYLPPFGYYPQQGWDIPGLASGPRKKSGNGGKKKNQGGNKSGNDESGDGSGSGDGGNGAGSGSDSGSGSGSGSGASEGSNGGNGNSDGSSSGGANSNDSMTNNNNMTENTSNNDEQQQVSANIRNYEKENKDIPDVPPPPLPSGAKTTE